MTTVTAVPGCWACRLHDRRLKFAEHDRAVAVGRVERAATPRAAERRRTELEQRKTAVAEATDNWRTHLDDHAREATP